MEIISAEWADQYLRPLISWECEEFWTLALGPRKELLGSRMLFRGTVDACMVHPRDIFRFGCITNASSLIIAHNHPSGELTPSDHDLRVTQQLIHAGRLLQIPILDHVILTELDFASFARKKWCRF